MTDYWEIEDAAAAHNSGTVPPYHPWLMHGWATPEQWRADLSRTRLWDKRENPLNPALVAAKLDALDAYLDAGGAS